MNHLTGRQAANRVAPRTLQLIAREWYNHSFGKERE